MPPRTPATMAVGKSSLADADEVSADCADAVSGRPLTVCVILNTPELTTATSCEPACCAEIPESEISGVENEMADTDPRPATACTACKKLAEPSAS